MEIVMVIAMICQRFRFTPLADEPLSPRPSYTLRPGWGTETVLAQRQDESRTLAVSRAQGQNT